MSTIFGWRHFDSGEVYVGSKKTKIRNPKDAIKIKIGYVPEDRKNLGLNLAGTIRNNIAVTLWDAISRFGFIKKKAENTECNKVVSSLSIKLASLDSLVNSLSGGNQQKVVLAKWLAMNMDILILDEPTRGIDVGAKAEIHKLIVNLVRQGVAIILISSEMEEVMSMSDRIIVMHEGTITCELNREEFEQEKILKYSMGLPVA